ncbi:Rab GDP dissociation inhibitor alpha, partial [Lobosporangium transversale]
MGKRVKIQVVTDEFQSPTSYFSPFFITVSIAQDEQYDIIVLCTGLTESPFKKKNLQLFKKFRGDEAPSSSLGNDTSYNVDLVPKFMMANGELVKILTHTAVTRYINFKQIAGSFVYRDGKIAKVPTTEVEAALSPLVGVMEKNRVRKFFEYVQNYNLEDPSTQNGLDIRTVSMEDVYKSFELEAGTIDFIGHALALHLDDSYLTRPAQETFERIRLYVSSMARYGKSPYLYPVYGLGDLPQGFARLSAVYGSTYMLDKKVDEIVYDANGKATGVRSGDEVAKASQIICDPSYAPNKVQKKARVIRAICLLNGPIPHTDKADSFQLIIPQNQVKRKHDIYIAGLSATHGVCDKDYYLAIVSTIVETENPEQEIQPALDLLGPYVE